MKYTQVATDAFEHIQLNAGVLVSDFDPTTATLDGTKILGATSGGINFTATPEYTDFGEDIDNVPKNTMELKKLDSVTVTLAGTFVTVSAELARSLAGPADVSGNKVTPRVDLLAGDFADLWWIGDYSDVNTGADAGFIAIHMLNTLSTGGFQIQSGDKAKGTFAFEYTAHYSIEDTDVVPYEIYVQQGAEGATGATGETGEE